MNIVANAFFPGNKHRSFHSNLFRSTQSYMIQHQFCVTILRLIMGVAVTTLETVGQGKRRSELFDSSRVRPIILI